MSADLTQEPYRRRYPELAALDAYYASGKGVPPEGNVLRRNILALPCRAMGL